MRSSLTRAERSVAIVQLDDAIIETSETDVRVVHGVEGGGRSRKRRGTKRGFLLIRLFCLSVGKGS